MFCTFVRLKLLEVDKSFKFLEILVSSKGIERKFRVLYSFNRRRRHRICFYHNPHTRQILATESHSDTLQPPLSLIVSKFYFDDR